MPILHMLEQQIALDRSRTDLQFIGYALALNNRHEASTVAKLVETFTQSKDEVRWLLAPWEDKPESESYLAGLKAEYEKVHGNVDDPATMNRILSELEEYNRRAAAVKAEAERMSTAAADLERVIRQNGSTLKQRFLQAKQR